MLGAVVFGVFLLSFGASSEVWQKIKKGVKYDYTDDIKVKPIRFKTTAYGTTDTVELHFYWGDTTSEYDWNWGRIRWRFTDFAVELYTCTDRYYRTTSNNDKFTDVPDVADRTWEVSWTTTEFTVKCNDETVWTYTYTFDYTDPEYEYCLDAYSNGEYGEVTQFEFKKRETEYDLYPGDTASTYYAAEATIDCKDGKGANYRGTIATTISGTVCQKWDSQYPHTHTRTPENYPFSGLGAHNYCRNPDGEPAPWCYTTGPDRTARYELCLIPECGWCLYDDSYLSGYSSGDIFYTTLAEAQEQCALRTDCGGITQEPGNDNMYTLRKGSVLNHSPSKETSWKTCTQVTEPATDSYV